MRKKKRKQGFSATKAVKAQARERLGQPKPARPIERRDRDAPERKRKHRETMAQLLASEEAAANLLK